MTGLQQQNFRVNLGGVIALLSKNLYSSPGVYVRELIQNAMDAIVARDALGGAPAPRIISISPYGVDLKVFGLRVLDAARSGPWDELDHLSSGKSNRMSQRCTWPGICCSMNDPQSSYLSASACHDSASLSRPALRRTSATSRCSA